MYVVFNSDGSIKYKQLNSFVQKGNNNVDELKVAIIGYTPDQYTMTLVPTLPDGTTASALLGSSETITIDEQNFTGLKFLFPNTITAQEGKLTINITATDLQSHNLVSSNVYVTVNPSGVESTDPVYLSYAEWQQLISGLGQYALKFSERTIRKYATLQEAQSDVANLVLNQVVVVKDSNSKYQLYEKTASSTLTQVEMPYLRLSGGTMTGDLDINDNDIENIDKLKLRNSTHNWDLEVADSNLAFTYDNVGIYSFDYSNFSPLHETDETYQNNLGVAEHKWNNLYLSGNLSDGTNSYSISQLASKTYATDKIAEMNYTKSFSLTYDANNVNISKVQHNGETKQDETVLENISLASSTQAGLMPKESVSAISQLQTDVAALKGQTVRLLYTASQNPTATDILNFVVSKGYTDITKYEGIAVVVSGTNHIWKWVNQTSVKGTWVWKNTLPSFSGISNLAGANFTSNNETYSMVRLQLIDDVFKVIYLKTAQVYDVVFENGAWVNDAYKTMNYGSTNKNVNTSFLTYLLANTDTQGTYSYGYFQDFGLDTVSQFTNNIAGVIKGKNQEGYVYAEDDGTGSVVGFDNLKTRVSNVESNKQDKFPTRTFTILSSAWVNNKYTYTIDSSLEIGDNDVVMVAPNTDDVYYNNQITYKKGTTNQDIEFTCLTIPEEDITITVIVFHIN